MMLAIETIKVTETVGRLVFLIYSVSIFYSVALAHTLSKLERLDFNSLFKKWKRGADYKETRIAYILPPF